MKTTKKYEVMLPYHQYLVYEVEADSPEEAIQLVESGYDKRGEQLSEHCSLGCLGTAKIKVKEIE